VLYRQVIKRLMDLVLASLGLVLLSPLFLVIAICVYLDSGRPIFYRGIRTGLHGNPFRIFKFRSMVPGAEGLGGGTTADRDPRLTRTGAFLRRYKLDELPQLFNVLQGNMSLVGPRPELEEYTKRYGREEQVILSVRPGLTDFASLEFIQLARLCGSTDADFVYETEILPQKNRLRILYARKLSFLVDVKIILKTILGILKLR